MDNPPENLIGAVSQCQRNNKGAGGVEAKLAKHFGNSCCSRLHGPRKPYRPELYAYYMGGCQNGGPFLGPVCNTAPSM